MGDHNIQWSRPNKLKELENRYNGHVIVRVIKNTNKITIKFIRACWLKCLKMLRMEVQ